MPASKEKLGCLPSPEFHTSTAPSRAAQLQVPAQLCKSCYSSPWEGSRGQLTTSCWQQTCATRACRIRIAEALNSELAPSFICPTGQQWSKKGFYPKCLKLTWTHTSSPDSTDVTQTQCDYSYFVEWLLKGFSTKLWHLWFTSTIHLWYNYSHSI